MTEDKNELEHDLARLLDEHDFKAPEVGDIRTGTIVSISAKGVILDLGLKRDGIVQPSDLERLDEETREGLSVNDEVPVYIVNTQGDEGLIVSIHRALQEEDWLRAQQLLESGDIIEVEIEGYNRGGLIVPFGGLRGFIPASHHTELNPGLNERQRQRRMARLKGRTFPARIIEVDPRRRRLVLSQRDAAKEWEEARKKELLEKLHEGETILGRVSSLSSFGAFVDVGGADGLIHVSELAWHRVEHPSEVVSVGDELEVFILRLDREGQRISLSRKQLLPNPWDSVEERYDVGQLVEGTITRIVNYGAFVEIEPGVEGLLHVSRLARNAEVGDPREVVGEGETHLLKIVSVNARRQRIALSLKSVTSQEQIDWMMARAVDEVEEPEVDSGDEIVDAPIAEAESAAPAAVTETAPTGEVAAQEADAPGSAEAATDEVATADAITADAATDDATTAEETAADTAMADAATAEETMADATTADAEAGPPDEVAVAMLAAESDTDGPVTLSPGPLSEEEE